MIVALLLALPCLADEVLLKDGRKIEFRSLEDAGATYTVTTPEGTRVVVKRADVEGFAKTEPASALTGASISFDKKSKTDSVDLLKKIEDKDFLIGSWKLLPDGSLHLTAPTGVENACCQIRHVPASDEYNLTLVVERTEGEDNIAVAFPTPGGFQCQFFFDVDKGKYSAVLTPGGPDGHLKASVPVQGKQLSIKKPRTIVFMVRKTGLVVQLDGKDVTTFRTDWTKIVPLCGPQARDAFAVSALTCGIRVSKMTVTVATGSGK
jgi:hypothetical protein